MNGKEGHCQDRSNFRPFTLDLSLKKNPKQQRTTNPSAYNSMKTLQCSKLTV